MAREEKPDVTVRDVQIKRESDKALLIITVDKEELWVPKSQVRGGTAVKAGDKGTVVLSAWIAGEKGLEDSQAGELNAGEDDTGGYDD